MKKANKICKSALDSNIKEINSICDNYFSFSISDIENSLIVNSKDKETYEGEKLEEKALNTSWCDYYYMINILEKKNHKMIDIGSSYSKGTMLSNALNINNIDSVEVVEKRVSYSYSLLDNLLIDRSNIFLSNALEFNYEAYDVYFIYQPVGKFLSRLLDLLANHPGKKLWVIESHGDLINRLDSDNRFTNKSPIFELNSKRHCSSLYEYTISNKLKEDHIKFETDFYRSTSALIETQMPGFGIIQWYSSLSNSSIDYIDGHLTVNIKNRRIPFNGQTERIIEFNPSLSPNNREMAERETINYNGIEQRILKHITSPVGYLELSTGGIVKLI